MDKIDDRKIGLDWLLIMVVNCEFVIGYDFISLREEQSACKGGCKC